MAILGVMAVATMVLYPAVMRDRRTAYRVPCLSHVKQTVLASELYESDFDRFPSRDAWVDMSYPYTKSWEVFHCPSFEGTAWGYAFNRRLSEAAMPVEAAKTPLLYDSVNPVKNASDLVASLPTVPRHTSNVMGYADGHAKALSRK